MAKAVRKGSSKQKRGGNSRSESVPKKFPDPSENRCLRKKVRYINIDEEVVVILLDKLELRLLAYLERPSARGKDLAAAVTFTVALFLVLVTAEFQPRLGVPSSSWQVLCGVCFAGSIVWSGFCIHSTIKTFRNRKGVKDFIAELKEDCKEIVSNAEWEYFGTNVDSDNTEPSRGNGKE